MPSYRVTLHPENQSVDLCADEPLLKAILREGLKHYHACGGVGRCSTCRVEVLDGLVHCQPRNEVEQKMADRLRLPPTVRLACQLKAEGDLTVRKLLRDSRDARLSKQQARCAGPIGEAQKATILFGDIEDFTPMSQRIPPFDLMFLVNKYFDMVGEVVTRHGGQMNNYVGDAFLAVFGLDDPASNPLPGVQAACEVLEQVERFSEEVQENLGAPFRVRIGIHWGEVIFGMMGAPGSERMSLIGEAVNIAARVESANKDARTRLLITDAVYQQVQDRVAIRETLRLRLKGLAELTNLYEVTGVLPETTAP